MSDTPSITPPTERPKLARGGAHRKGGQRSQRLTANQETFAAHVIAGKSYAEAYKLAYVGAKEWSNAAAGSQGSRAARIPAVKALIEKADQRRQQVILSALPSAAEVRHKIFGGLLEMAEDPDKRIRLRAIELLGKTDTYGVFANRTIHQHESAGLNTLLQRLAQLCEVAAPPQQPPAIEAAFVALPAVSAEPVDPADLPELDPDA